MLFSVHRGYQGRFFVKKKSKRETGSKTVDLPPHLTRSYVHARPYIEMKNEN